MSLPALARPLPKTSSLGATDRRDAWWFEPLLTDVVFIAFALYGFWAMTQEGHFEYGPYLSPFFSPNLREMFPDVFKNLAFSPALLVLMIPLGFRATCYFFRRTYYRSIFLSPGGCAVDKGQTTGYTGETQFPFVFQNMHRYFLYLAIILAIFHWFHAWDAMWFETGWGIHTGTLVIWLDSILLTLYVVSCHSFRHLMGGRKDCFVTCEGHGKAHAGAYQRQSLLNHYHGVFGWTSLFAVAFADFYVRMLSMGIWTDIPLI